MKHSPLTNRSVLVTGATGSFGNAFVRHALDSGASKVVVFSRDELKQSQMRGSLQDDRIRFVVGDVTNRDRVGLAVRDVDYVVHAAAMKQIDTCEKSPVECKQTNIDGTEAVAMACIEAGVKRAVFLSTDKASQPNTHYGACKLAAERLWTQANVYAAGTGTRLVATRYGNVINSRGSVIPLFRKQAENGGPLTITDPNMTRFWMRIEEAVRLVELALGEGRGGDVFIPKIPSASILTVAEAVAPGVVRKEIGIRGGEKLHEVLIAEDEARNAFDHNTHYRIEPDRTWETLGPCGGAPVPEGWSYRSETNPDQLDVEGFRKLMGETP